MKIFFSIILFLCFWGPAQNVFSDVVVLKNGKIFEGKIIKQTSVYIRLKPAKSKISFQEFLVPNVKEVIIGDKNPYKAQMESALGQPVPSVTTEKISIPSEVPPAMNELTSAQKKESITSNAPLTNPVQQKTAQVLSNETIREMENQFATTATPVHFDGKPQNKQKTLQRMLQRMLAEKQRLGGEFSMDDMEPEAMDAMVAEMEKELEISLKQQIPAILGWFVKTIFTIVFIVGLIAFFINRFIDDDIEIIGPKAGFWRRLMAALIDGTMGAALIGLMMTLPGLLIPMDSPQAKAVFILAIILSGLYSWYLVFGYVLWANTYGRYVMNLRVVDFETGEKPRYAQAFVRTLGFILWPIELMVLILSKSKRRIGDAWAGTRVKVVESQKKWWQRALVGIIIIFLGNMMVSVLTPIASSKMHIAQAARKYLGQQTDLHVQGNPQAVEIQASPGLVQGTITYALENAGGKNILLLLVHNPNGWAVQDMRLIKKKYFGLMTISY